MTIPSWPTTSPPDDPGPGAIARTTPPTHTGLTAFSDRSSMFALETLAPLPCPPNRQPPHANHTRTRALWSFGSCRRAKRTQSSSFLHSQPGGFGAETLPPGRREMAKRTQFRQIGSRQAGPAAARWQNEPNSARLAVTPGELRRTTRIDRKHGTAAACNGTNEVPVRISRQRRGPLFRRYSTSALRHRPIPTFTPQMRSDRRPRPPNRTEPTGPASISPPRLRWRSQPAGALLRLPGIVDDRGSPGTSGRDVPARVPGPRLGDRSGPGLHEG